MKKILLFSFFLNSLFCHAQTADGGDLLNDFNIIVRSLQELHPKLYTNISKDDFDTRVAQISNRLLVTSSRSKAIYMIQELFYELGNSHAGNASVYKDVSAKKVLPFSVYILDHDIYIKNCPANPTLNGLHIKAIEHTPSAKLVDSLKIFFPTDGKTNIISYNLQPLFNSLYANFCIQKDTFLIDTDKGPMKLAAALDGSPAYDELIVNNAAAYFGEDRILKKTITADYGYFKFIGFVPEYKGFEIEKEFNAFIAEANQKQLPAIIIDLRYNNGGDPYLAGRMTAALADHPFKIFEKVYLTDIGVPTYLHYMKNKGSYRGRNFKVKGKDGYVREVVRREPGLKTTEPSVNRYKGKIYIITGSITQSASTMMCKYLMDQPNVTFVGAQPIGSINYFWASSHCQLTLPDLNTVFSFGTELLELNPGCSSKELPLPLIPDHVISYNLEELMQKKDKEMEFILQDLKK